MLARAAVLEYTKFHFRRMSHVDEQSAQCNLVYDLLRVSRLLIYVLSRETLKQEQSRAME